MPRRDCCHNEWTGKMRGCGFRITEGRETILNVLINTPDKHLSAEDIYGLIREKNPTIGLTTVYRTLEILVDMGMVFKFDFGDKRARYELIQGSAEDHHHHHLVCTACHRIIDYTDFIDEEVELLKKTEKGLSEKYQFDIKNHVIQFFGICNTCKV